MSWQRSRRMRQVIGRVQSGHEVLSEIVSFGAGDDDEPLEPVVISRCGAVVTCMTGGHLHYPCTHHLPSRMARQHW